MLATLALPMPTKRGIRQLQPSSWLGIAKSMLNLAINAVLVYPSEDGTIWTKLSPEQISRIRQKTSKSPGVQRHLSNGLRRLIYHGQRGEITDYPRPTPTPAIKSESDYKNRQPVQSLSVQHKQFQPYPDEFVTELLWRGLWLNKNLSAQIIECWNELRLLNDRAFQRGIRATDPRLIAARREVVTTRDWRLADGAAATKLPFKILQFDDRRSRYDDTWPPNFARTINNLISAIQGMNYCIVAFCTGARVSELSSAQSPEDWEASRLTARTFKFAQQTGGEERDWPLHPLAIEALVIQDKLASVVRSPQSRHLWVGIQNERKKTPAGEEILDKNAIIASAVKALSLSGLLGNGGANSHRWRTTLARLIALSVVASPQVVMDLFGHKDLQMALGYMLAHPEIVQEVLRVAEEMVYVNAEEAIRDGIAGSLGGPAAPAVSNAIERYRMKRGETEFLAHDLRDAARIFTFEGRTWELVREGVICTKGVGQFGPCTQSRGDPDPGACRTTCSHRLELQAARAQCFEAIGSLLHEFEDAQANGFELLAANLEGQILSQLARWDDVRTEWLERSESLRTIWQRRQSRVGR
ncbi:integrase [Microvirga sp. TS319]|uniref:integrase n=1 Tax=Microvirga sp. TS319 TaxID=3241165 RepID=UPI00351A5BE9